ncbi:hypothetical protein F383_22195 [Gossypium arboreum]|uniref:Uncharacterized protein n=1 Tax=Gossypium arboreum TaxID=29729 RepID=A0A0B0P1I3_GOSAR|nr:hypothetical protein F383_22195 [Gossypium arboreum]
MSMMMNGKVVVIFIFMQLTKLYAYPISFHFLICCLISLWINGRRRHRSHYHLKHLV